MVIMSGLISKAWKNILRFFGNFLKIIPSYFTLDFFLKKNHHYINGKKN